MSSELENYIDTIFTEEELVAQSTLGDPLSTMQLDSSLVFKDVGVMQAAVRQGQYSSEIASLTDSMMASVTYPGDAERPPLKLLTQMAEKDPVVSQCVSVKAQRAQQSFGDYKNDTREMELFIQSQFDRLRKNFDQTLFKIFYSTILYGIGIAEFTLRNHRGQTILESLNVLNPEQIISFKRRSTNNKKGQIEFVEYDNGGGHIVEIPYKKCIHIINNAGAAFDKREVWGVGNGIAALPYHNLKKIILTNLGLAVKNNSSGLLHVKVPPNGQTLILDASGNPIKKNGVEVKVPKQVGLSYQMQDIYKKDFVVTDDNVVIDRIQINNTNDIHFQSLTYIDRAIQQAFGVPSGIFDANGNGGANFSNQGLSSNYKMVFDATITSLTNLLKNELIQKLVRRLLYMNFPGSWSSDNFGEFLFDVEDDQATINGRLSTIASLIASGILPANDVNILNLIYKNLGLPAMDDGQKREKQIEEMNQKAQKTLEAQANALQLQTQMQQMMAPPPEEGYPEEEPPAA